MKLDVKEIFEKDYVGKLITVEGWVRNHRKQKEFGFIDFSDGTYFKHLQIVYDDKNEKLDNCICSYIYKFQIIRIISLNYLDIA